MVNELNKLIKAEERIKNSFIEHFKNDLNKPFFFESNLNIYRFRKQILDCVRHIPYESKVLEVGSGHGYILAHLKALRPDIKLTGSDKTPTSTWKLLEEKGYNIIQDDILNSKQSSNSFDVIISFGVMEHTGDPQQFLKEIYRILKSGGVNLIFNLPTKYALNDFIARKLKIGGHKDRYAKKRIYRLLKKTGFRNIYIKREFLIPAQVNRISKTLNSLFNKYYRKIDMIDTILNKTPASILAQTYTIKTQK